VDWFSIPIRLVTWPPQKFNRWTKKRGSDRNALVREGSEILTPVIDMANKVGPAGIMFGSSEEISTRLREWDEEWTQLRGRLLTYANAHPSDEVRKLANELVEAIRVSFSATYYLFITLNTASRGEGMETFHNAERRHDESIALAEKVLERIRRY
jgi:hypothetical protein